MARMFSIYCINSTAIEMQSVSNEEMDAMSKNDEYKAIPIYYSEDGRVWPLRGDCVIVTQEITTKG